MKLFDQYRNLSRAVYIISFSRLVTSLGAFIWPLFVMILRVKIGLGAAEIATFVTTSMVLGFIAQLIGGVLADKFGKKNTIKVFVLLAILTFASAMLVPISMTTAYILLLGQIFWSVSGPANDALMANVTLTEERESAYSLSYLAMNVGIAVGPALGGLLLVNHFNLFILIDVLTSLAAYLLLMIFVFENDDKIVVNRLEEEYKEPIWKIFKDRPVIFAWALMGIVGSFMYGQLNLTLPLYVEHLLGEEGTKIFGFMYSVNGLTVVLGVSVLTYLLRKRTAITKMMLGYSIYVLSFLLWGFNTSVLSLFLIIIFFTIGEIIIVIGVSPITSKIVPENLLGRVSATLGIFYMIGHGGATLLSGFLLDTDYTYVEVWLIIAFISLVGMGYFAFFKVKYGHIIDKVDSFDRNREL